MSRKSISNALYRRFKRAYLAVTGKYRVSGPRIVGIGFSKTGTTTLGRCFDILGIYPSTYSKNAPYISLKPLTREITKYGNYGPALNAAIRYRAFQDRPWNFWNMYKLMDAAFPGSKFILTYRDPENWWSSVERWLTVTNKHRPDKLQRYFDHLRTDKIDKDIFIQGYNQYNEEVTAYFSNRNDFLVFNIGAGDGWNKLCEFLEMPVPDVPFPHANKQQYG